MSNNTCDSPPAVASSDPGIAGAGVLISFIITAGLALILSASIIVRDLLDRNGTKQVHASKIMRKILLGLSDQQILTGIGIQSLALAKIDTIIPMHFFIVWMLGLLSSATHLSTLLALVGDFQRDWVLRWLRQFLMFVNIALSSIMGILLFMSVVKNVPQTIPMLCAWSSPGNGLGAANAGISIAGTITVMAVNCGVFGLATWYLHSSRKWLRTIQGLSLALLTAMSIGAASRVIMVSSAFGTPSVPLADTSEKDWSFGQLLPLLLLLLPLLSALEIVRGKRESFRIQSIACTNVAYRGG